MLAFGSRPQWHLCLRLALLRKQQVDCLVTEPAISACTEAGNRSRFRLVGISLKILLKDLTLDADGVMEVMQDGCACLLPGSMAGTVDPCGIERALQNVMDVVYAEGPCTRTLSGPPGPGLCMGMRMRAGDQAIHEGGGHAERPAPFAVFSYRQQLPFNMKTTIRVHATAEVCRIGKMSLIDFGTFALEER